MFDVNMHSAAHTTPANTPPSATEGMMQPPRLARLLVLSVAAVSLAGLVSVWLQFTLVGSSKTVVFLIDLDSEVNLATWFAVLLLTGNAALLALAAETASRGERPLARAWWALSMLFLMLSLDEFVSLHERAGRLVHGALDLPGLPTFSWLVPAAVVLPMLLWLFAGFLQTLPRKTCHGVLLSAAVYVSGAFGMEIVSAFYLGDGSTWDPVYKLITWAEESLEMAGQALFMHVLAQHVGLGRIIRNAAR